MKWSEADRNQLMEEYAKSGKTKKEFCQERGINLGTFYGWAKREPCKSEKKTRKSKSTFQEISVPVDAGHAVEIILPGGVRVCLRNNGSHEELAGLIRGIVAC